MRNAPLAAALLMMVGGMYSYVRGDNSGEVPATSTHVGRIAADRPGQSERGVISPPILPRKSSDSLLLLSQASATSSPPSGLHPKPGGRVTRMHRVALSWQPSANGLISGDSVTYNVYRCSDTVSSSCAQINVEPVTTPEYVDDHVRSGKTYYYATTAVDQDGRQSHISNVVKVAVPFP